MMTRVADGTQRNLNKLARRVRERLGDGFIISTGYFFEEIRIEERYTGPNPFSDKTYNESIEADYLWDHFDFAMKVTKLKYGVWKWMREHGLV